MGYEKSKAGACKHNVLIGICTEDFIREALADQPEHRVAMTRNIILANIKRNRVTGLMSREAIPDTAAWMRAYARRVSHHLHTERERWAKFCGLAANNELAELLAGFARDSSPSLLDVDEVLNQSFFVVKDRIRTQFPFDVSVDEWLAKLTRAVAIHMVREGRTSQRDTACYEEMGFDDALVNAPDDSFFSQTDEWLESMDIRQMVSKLKPRQRDILWRAVNGQTPDQIGLALHRSTKTVQNNLTQIGKQLGRGIRQ